jgi:hypothetical protein
MTTQEGVRDETGSIRRELPAACVIELLGKRGALLRDALQSIPAVVRVANDSFRGGSFFRVIRPIFSL